MTVWLVKIIELRPNLEERDALTFRVNAQHADAWQLGLDYWRRWLDQHPNTPSKLTLTTPVDVGW